MQVAYFIELALLVSHGGQYFSYPYLLFIYMNPDVVVKLPLQRSQIQKTDLVRFSGASISDSKNGRFAGGLDVVVGCNKLRALQYLLQAWVKKNLKIP